jgi:hypothetical protein
MGKMEGRQHRKKAPVFDGGQKESLCVMNYSTNYRGTAIAM